MNGELSNTVPTLGDRVIRVAGVDGPAVLDQLLPGRPSRIVRLDDPDLPRKLDEAHRVSSETSRRQAEEFLGLRVDG